MCGGNPWVHNTFNMSTDTWHTFISPVFSFTTFSRLRTQQYFHPILTIRYYLCLFLFKVAAVIWTVFMSNILLKLFLIFRKLAPLALTSLYFSTFIARNLKAARFSFWYLPNAIIFYQTNTQGYKTLKYSGDLNYYIY